ncbi:hypothetical protein [Altererythrobacter sp. MTPC7]|uniref:hypothetical protein n=1 Tax=Altererythrobacter sp. MTPC7 TaxID=3056567 RepID=UPI0036F36AAC
MTGITAYIEESGCDGFEFEDGSSDFLVLGAVISRTSNLGQFDEAVTDIRAALRKDAGYTCQSFKKLNSAPQKRWAISANLAKRKIQTVAVAIHKPSLDKEEWATNKDDLYFYGSQFLAQRISWACRAAHEAKAEADPICRIVFSQRGHLRYDDFKGYIRRLRDNPERYTVDMAWEHVDPDHIDAEVHDDRVVGHLAADHFVSSIGSALEFKEYGQFDDRYARI